MVSLGAKRDSQSWRSGSPAGKVRSSQAWKPRTCTPSCRGAATTALQRRMPSMMGSARGSGLDQRPWVQRRSTSRGMPRPSYSAEPGRGARRHAPSNASARAAERGVSGRISARSSIASTRWSTSVMATGSSPSTTTTSSGHDHVSTTMEARPRWRARRWASSPKARLRVAPARERKGSASFTWATPRSGRASSFGPSRRRRAASVWSLSISSPAASSGPKRNSREGPAWPLAIFITEMTPSARKKVASSRGPQRSAWVGA